MITAVQNSTASDPRDERDGTDRIIRTIKNLWAEVDRNIKIPSLATTPANDDHWPRYWDFNMLKSAQDVAEVCGVASLFLKQNIIDRIQQLHGWTKSPSDDQDAMSLQSLKRAISFIITQHFEVAPDIVLAPTGAVQIEWYRSPTIQFAVQFPDAGHLHFLIRDEDGRFSGAASETAIKNIMNQHRVGMR